MNHFVWFARLIDAARRRRIVLFAPNATVPVRVIRNSDGVHLTDDGARIYGQQSAHDLGADLGILTAPKPC